MIFKLNFQQRILIFNNERITRPPIHPKPFDTDSGIHHIKKYLRQIPRINAENIA